MPSLRLFTLHWYSMQNFPEETLPFIKYSSIEQDHIKHFLPFHTVFGIKFYIKWSALVFLVGLGPRLLKDHRMIALRACMPLAQQKHQVMLLCVKQGFPRGQSQHAKGTPKNFKYNALGLRFCLRDAFLCLLKHKNTAAKQMYMKWPKQCVPHSSPSGRKRRR